MSLNDISKLAQAIDWVEQRLDEANLYFGHGTDNARDEAAWLVLGALGLSFDINERDLQQELSASDKLHIQELLTQRISGRLPLAYIFKQAWFCGLPFFVDERVLIPRSPVAELIEERFEPWTQAESVKRILDIGTGSGCIAIAAALSFPFAQVDAADISQDAIDVARVNVEQHGLQHRVLLHCSNLFENVPKTKYDVIIANPPYVDAEDMSALPAEYLHEPRQALEAGDDGLDLVRLIIEQSRDYLAKTGILVVEVGNSQAALESAYPEAPFTWLDFAYGGHGVFLLTATQLDKL